MRRALILALERGAARRGARGLGEPARGIADPARAAPAASAPCPPTQRDRDQVPDPRPLTGAYAPPPDPAAKFSPKPTRAHKPEPDPLCPAAATAAVHGAGGSEEGLTELKALMAVAAPDALLAAARAVATAPRRVPRAAVDAVGAALARRVDDVESLVSAAQAFAAVGVFSPDLKSALSAALRARAATVDGHALARALRAFSALAAWDDGVVGVAVERLTADPSAFDAADVADIAQAATHLGAFSQELTAAIGSAVPVLAAKASSEDLAHLASALAAARAAPDSTVMAHIADRVTNDAPSFGPVGLPRALRALVRSGYADSQLLDAAADAAATLAPRMSNAGLARVARAYADVGAPAPAACDAVDAEAADRVAKGRMHREAATDILDAFNILGHPAPRLAAAMGVQEKEEAGGGA